MKKKFKSEYDLSCDFVVTWYLQQLGFNLYFEKANQGKIYIALLAIRVFTAQGYLLSERGKEEKIVHMSWPTCI